MLSDWPLVRPIIYGTARGEVRDEFKVGGFRVAVKLNRISQMPQVKEKLLVQGFEMLPPISPDAARKLIEDDQALWLPIIEKSGAKAE